MNLIGRKFKLIDERADDYLGHIYELVKINDNKVTLINCTMKPGYWNSDVVNNADDITWEEWVDLTLGYKFGCLGGFEIKRW